MREPNAVDKYLRINPQTRLFEPNWMYRDILPFALGPDPARYTSGAIALVAGVPQVIPYKPPHSSGGYDDQVGTPIQINEIVGTSSGGITASNFMVFFTDPGDQRQYMNYPCHVRTIAGSGQLAARLTEDLFLPTRHQLNVQMVNISGGETAQLYFMGKMFDTFSSNLQSHPADHKAMIDLINKHLERRKYVTPYWLTPPPSDGALGVTVPANQTVDVEALVGDEGHFECTHIMRAFTSGDATTSPFELELINPQTRQSIMNGRIHSMFIGDAVNPQPFPAPFIIPAGQLLRFRITDLSGSTNTVYLTLRGMKVRAPFKSRDDVDREFGIHRKAKDPAKDYTLEMAGA